MKEVPICCGYCKKYLPIKNPNMGMCSAQSNYFQVRFDDKCHYTKTDNLKCMDCGHFVNNDAACMTANATDSAYHDDGELCGGFELWYTVELENNLYRLFCDNGGDAEKTLNDIKMRIENFEVPWEKRE